MFVQVITAKVTDRDALERQVDQWEKEIRPLADGFLGSTSGITDDGHLFVMVRFESEDAARRHSDRPEQSAWWAETEKSLSDVEFKDSVRVTLTMGGGSNDAGFVQVMRGRIKDEAKMKEMESRSGEFEAGMSKHRPDVLGDVTAVHADGTFSDVIYFRSESEARENEKKDMPPEMASMFEDYMAAAEIEEYIDLKAPRLV